MMKNGKIGGLMCLLFLFMGTMTGCFPKLEELPAWWQGGDTAAHDTNTITDTDSEIDGGTDTDTDADADTGDSADTGTISPGDDTDTVTDTDKDTDIDTDSDSDTETDTGTGTISPGDDTEDTGEIPPSVLYATDFGDGASCTTSPFVRSDGGSMSSASYSSGSECGVYIFGSGSSSAPSVSLDYSASGYTPGVEYTATMTVEAVGDSSLTVYADFGGGAVVASDFSPGSSEIISVSWTADASGATLRVWSSSASNYEGVVQDLLISY